jgi:hypothetical protein
VLVDGCLLSHVPLSETEISHVQGYIMRSVKLYFAAEGPLVRFLSDRGQCGDKRVSGRKGAGADW